MPTFLPPLATFKAIGELVKLEVAKASVDAAARRQAQGENTLTAQSDLASQRFGTRPGRTAGGTPGSPTSLQSQAPRTVASAAFAAMKRSSVVRETVSRATSGVERFMDRHATPSGHAAQVQHDAFDSAQMLQAQVASMHTAAEEQAAMRQRESLAGMSETLPRRSTTPIGTERFNAQHARPSAHARQVQQDAIDSHNLLQAQIASIHSAAAEQVAALERESGSARAASPFGHAHPSAHSRQVQQDAIESHNLLQAQIASIYSAAQEQVTALEREARDEAAWREQASVSSVLQVPTEILPSPTARAHDAPPRVRTSAKPIDAREFIAHHAQPSDHALQVQRDALESLDVLQAQIASIRSDALKQAETLERQTEAAMAAHAKAATPRVHQEAEAGLELAPPDRREQPFPTRSELDTALPRESFEPSAFAPGLQSSAFRARQPLSTLGVSELESRPAAHELPAPVVPPKRSL